MSKQKYHTHPPIVTGMEDFALLEQQIHLFLEVAPVMLCYKEPP